MTRLFVRLRSFWRGLRRRDVLEQDMGDEFRLHVELRAKDLERAGVPPAEALRRARIEFGGVEELKEHARASRGLRYIDGLRVSWIDIKLGVRMLRKYPGLTIVGGLGIAVAITVAAVMSGVIYTAIDPRLPLDEGDRIVAVENLDTATSNEDHRAHLHDLDAWRTGVPAIADFGAYRAVDRNLITAAGRVEAARIAEMTASGFRIARVKPLLGRYLVDDDELPAAAPVVVLGFSVWQSRFAAAPDVVGQTLRIGAVEHTIVGVMPADFGFPINNRIWTALRLRAAQFDYGRAPEIDVFGRLAPGATIAAAQEQLDAVGQRLAEASPEIRRHLRTQVVPYPHVFLDGPDALWLLNALQMSMSLLLAVIGTNVAVLVYARTATRAGEITVRTALGASRLRVVTQFFAEALVLSAGAAVIGLFAARYALQRLDALLVQVGGEQVPYWIHFGITPGIVIYVAGLAVFAAVIVGVVPALKATGQRVQSSLQQLGVGRSGMRLGRVWTFMIIAQVTITVALMPIVVGGGIAWLRWQLSQRSFSTEAFVTTTLLLDRSDAAGTGGAAARLHADRYAATKREFISRLEQEASATDLLLMSDVPGGEPTRRIDLDVAGPQGSNAVPTGFMLVGRGFIETFQIPVLTGRPLGPNDFSASPTAVVVNEAFVNKVLGAGAALGRRARLIDADGKDAPGPWFEIVGVVANFPAALDARYVRPRIYAPLLDTDPRASVIAVRARDGDAAALVPRLREIAAAVDPTLRLGELQPLDLSLRDQRMILELMLLATALVSGSALMLSTAGIYAIVSLTVTRRRREIAVRVALGADARRVLGNLLSRALAQISVGIAIGIGVALFLNTLDWTGVVVVGAFMFLVGIVASIGPARRGLRIQPTEALKAE